MPDSTPTPAQSQHRKFGACADCGDPTVTDSRGVVHHIKWPALHYVFIKKCSNQAVPVPAEPPQLATEIAKAIATIEESRESHVEWRDHYKNKPNCTDCPPDVVRAAGDLRHQEECVAKYDQVLAAFRAAESELTRSRAALLELNFVELAAKVMAFLDLNEWDYHKRNIPHDESELAEFLRQEFAGRGDAAAIGAENGGRTDALNSSSARNGTASDSELETVRAALLEMERQRDELARKVTVAEKAFALDEACKLPGKAGEINTLQLLRKYDTMCEKLEAAEQSLAQQRERPDPATCDHEFEEVCLRCGKNCAEWAWESHQKGKG